MDYLLEAYNNTYNGGGAFDKQLVYDQMIANSSVATGSLENWIAAGKPNYNWSRLLQNKDALVNIINFSATGGDEKSNFYASLGYNKTEGTMIGSEFRRVSGVFSFDRQLSDKVDFGFSTNVANIKQEGILEQGAFYSNPNMIRYFMSPWNSPYNEDGSANIDRRNCLDFIIHYTHWQTILRLTTLFELLQMLKFLINSPRILSLPHKWL